MAKNEVTGTTADLAGSFSQEPVAGGATANRTSNEDPVEGGPDSLENTGVYSSKPKFKKGSDGQKF